MSSYQPFTVPSRSKRKFVSCKKKNVNKRRPACKKRLAEIQPFLGYSLKEYCSESRAGGRKKKEEFPAIAEMMRWRLYTWYEWSMQGAAQCSSGCCAGSSESRAGEWERGDAQRPAGIVNSLKFPPITRTSETLWGSLLIGSSQL